MAKTHAQEILRNLIAERLVYVEDDKVFCWQKADAAEISEENVKYEDCNFEGAPQSSQAKKEESKTE